MGWRASHRTVGQCVVLSAHVSMTRPRTRPSNVHCCQNVVGRGFESDGFDEAAAPAPAAEAEAEAEEGSATEGCVVRARAGTTLSRARA